MPDSIFPELSYGVWIFIGAGLGALWLGSCKLLARGKLKAERQLWGIGLIGAAVIYLCFAMIWSGNPEDYIVELIGIGVYTSLACAGLYINPFFLGAGWGVHVAWDVGVHADAFTAEASYVPYWYGPACIGFDILSGVVLMCWELERQPPHDKRML
eukprot:TRINITY_DN67666_c10_g2_i1.p1 TRINITY_DN67666_c10_g2~~TRINITY_DN67666_c10_g2_i1.p1  ORF type:complete len:156 (-),score=10.61 TRINITY_DN67666_c10_g2_i1:124-591(-)